MKNIALKLYAVLFTSLALLSLPGCLEPEARKTETEDAQALVDSFNYVKAKNGLCFGVGTTMRLSTSGEAAAANITVVVDCAKVGL